MPRAVRRFSVLSGVALCAVLGGPIAVAQASDNTLRQTLNSFASKIVKDENAVRNGSQRLPARQGQATREGPEPRGRGPAHAEVEALPRARFVGQGKEGEEGHHQGARPDRHRLRGAARRCPGCPRRSGPDVAGDRRGQHRQEGPLEAPRGAPSAEHLMALSPGRTSGPGSATSTAC